VLEPGFFGWAQNDPMEMLTLHSRTSTQPPFLSFATTDYLISIMAETRVPNKLYATHPKNYGKGSRQCVVTGRKGGNGLIRKYGINMKRQAFRERAIDMGWVKYS